LERVRLARGCTGQPAAVIKDGEYEQIQMYDAFPELIERLREAKVDVRAFLTLFSLSF
jgi:hypothetical protein